MHFCGWNVWIGVYGITKQRRVTTLAVLVCAYRDYNVISGVGVWCQVEVRVYDKKVPGVRVALAAGNINSVWPLLCCGWWQCVTHTHTHVHGNLASQCHWRLLRWPVSIRDSHQRDIRGGGDWERCGCWERETKWEAKRRREESETIKKKQSRRWWMMQTQTYSKKKKKTNSEGQKTLACKEKKQSTNDCGCRNGWWGLIRGAVQCGLPFSRHCSLPRSSGHTLISHVCQQHE